MNNQRLSEVLRELAELRLASGEAEAQVKRIQRVAYAVSRLTEPASVLAETGRLTEIPGVGGVTAGLICEYLADGDSRERRKLLRQLPETVRELMQIPGIGAQTALKIYQKTRISRLPEFREALRENRLTSLSPVMLARLNCHFGVQEPEAVQGELIF